MTRKQLAILMKETFGVSYTINGANTFVRNFRGDLGELRNWLEGTIPGGGVVMSTSNPHFRACYYTTPFWLSLYIEK